MLMNQKKFNSYFLFFLKTNLIILRLSFEIKRDLFSKIKNDLIEKMELLSSQLRCWQDICKESQRWILAQFKDFSMKLKKKGRSRAKFKRERFPLFTGSIN